MPTARDRWDGYPAARMPLFDGVTRAKADLVVLSGDSHNACGFDLDHRGKPIGVEFAGHSVSSLGIDKRFGGDPAAIARDIRSFNPNLAWCDTSRRGYMVVDVARTAVTTDWLFLSARDTQSLELIGRETLAVERRDRHLPKA